SDTFMVLSEYMDGGGFSIGISSETIRNENQLAKISYSNPYQIGKNDGSLLPQDEIYIEINSSDYGYDSIKELEEDLTLNIYYWMGEKDPRFGSIEPPSDMHSDKTMKVSEALKAEPLSMNDVVSTRNQNLPGVLKFQQKSNRMAVSFSFEKIN
ncbi:MAG: hypothetical protein HKN99_10455, partial [Winogradskyella sp.]|nr:hypothetical protein [Winogradskyella sp.]